MRESESPDRNPLHSGSRSSRRKQRRREAKCTSQDKPQRPTFSRRHLEQASVAGLLVASTAMAAVAGKDIHERFFSEKSIVLKEADRLGIKQSEAEKALWKRGPKREPNYFVAQNQETLVKATNMFEAAIRLTRESENPIFKQTLEFFDTLLTTGRLRFFLRPPGEGNEREVPMQTRNQFRAGSDSWVLEASAMWIINKQDPINTILLLVHETEHIRNEYNVVNELVKRNPNTTNAQKLSVLDARHANRHEAIAEEARGYGVFAQAYIWHVGLTRSILENQEIDDLKRAVGFIKAGSKVDSPAWLEYIEKNNLN